jgi:hypothetical protein
MNDKDFRDLVAKMRQAQKDYFRTRDREVLSRSKELEKLVDTELANDVEPSLF